MRHTSPLSHLNVNKEGKNCSWNKVPAHSSNFGLFSCVNTLNANMYPVLLTMITDNPAATYIDVGNTAIIIIILI